MSIPTTQRKGRLWLWVGPKAGEPWGQVGPRHQLRLPDPPGDGLLHVGPAARRTLAPRSLLFLPVGTNRCLVVVPPQPRGGMVTYWFSEFG